ncbi:hypothetical protein [Halomarina oriensis]|uniref:Uncharacterized protein n=1 Tax=Halomarina oriensis TaxID=671145 RepID=A0A6B0GYV6_9EURY|nr:hypothetical protein [Halomarina oriensis]MWG36938.1 hypothetical protein [Halomarina oriensis]
MPYTYQSEKGSRHEYERTTTDCPQGCANPSGGMRRVTHYTGKIDVFDVYGEEIEQERTDRYLECPTCGWVVDL